MDRWLDQRQVQIKNKILKDLSAAGYEPQIFFSDSVAGGLATGQAWTFQSVNEVMRRSHGALIFGFPRWRFPREDGEVRFATEHNHCEGGIGSRTLMPDRTYSSDIAGSPMHAK